ncbi:MAG: CHASE2 domain-containing protein [Acidobacteria bacterium]|nr:CHASE2 domain-containing protein [Acidobacteriota bacterium]MBV9187329.1 CHASE2 domain-containing protein [Acidobacteriota bacterium]
MLRTRTAVMIAIAVGVAVTLLLALDVVDPVELPARDMVLRRLPQHAAQRTVVVAIDEQSLRVIGAWPWDRAKLATIVDRAADAGARGVILDILLAEPRNGDEKLAASAKRLPVLAVAVVDEQGRWLMPRPPLSDSVTAAHGNFELDHDGILRRLSSTKQSGDRSLTALSVEAASLITGAPIPVGRSIAPAFRTRPSAIPAISAADLLRNPAKNLRGKLVFVGPTALALGDRVLTPTTRGHQPDPGVTVHAAATESIIRGDVITELPPIVAGVFATIGIAAILIARRRRIAASIVIAAIVAGGIALLANGTAIPFITLIASAAIAAGVLETRIIIAALRSSEERYIDHRERDAESKRVLAHELKTPLASMRSLTQLMNGFDLSDAERKRVTSLLQHEAGKLETMVGTLLDLERLPLRDFASSSTIIDLGDLASARVDFLRASTDRTLFVSADRDVFIRADAALLERVVDNLVGNALKYTTGAVTVRVVRRGNDAILEVEDRGPGISETEREKIFARFVRGTTAAGTNGLGLGLSLISEIAKWHGGAASLDSAQGGSRFRITLPVAAESAKAGAM